MGARDLLADVARAGLSVTADGGRLVIRPASMLTPDMREALRACKPELLALLTQTPGPAVQPCDLARHTADTTPPEVAPPELDPAKLARLQAFKRRGFDPAEAEELAGRLAWRDADRNDRALCLECANLAGSVPSGWRCGRPRAADVAAQLPRLMVAQLQRCPAFQVAPWCEALPRPS